MNAEWLAQHILSILIDCAIRAIDDLDDRRIVEDMMSGGGASTSRTQVWSPPIGNPEVYRMAFLPEVGQVLVYTQQQDPDGIDEMRLTYIAQMEFLEDAGHAEVNCIWEPVLVEAEDAVGLYYGGMKIKAIEDEPGSDLRLVLHDPEDPYADDVVVPRNSLIECWRLLQGSPL